MLSLSKAPQLYRQHIQMGETKGFQNHSMGILHRTIRKTRGMSVNEVLIPLRHLPMIMVPFCLTSALHGLLYSNPCRAAEGQRMWFYNVSEENIKGAGLQCLLDPLTSLIFILLEFFQLTVQFRLVSQVRWFQTTWHILSLTWHLIWRK